MSFLAQNPDAVCTQQDTFTKYWVAANNVKKHIAFGRGGSVGAQTMLSVTPPPQHCHFPVNYVVLEKFKFNFSYIFHQGFGTWDKLIEFRKIQISGVDFCLHGLEDSETEFILPGILGRYIYRFHDLYDS